MAGSCHKIVSNPAGCVYERTHGGLEGKSLRVAGVIRALEQELWLDEGTSQCALDVDVQVLGLSLSFSRVIGDGELL